MLICWHPLLFVTNGGIIGGIKGNINMKLNDTKIKALKPKQKIYKVFDGNGLYLEVKPTSNKSWRYKYRYFGKEKCLTIGKYPAITLRDAREQHLAAQKLLYANIDPAAKKQQEKQNLQKDLLNNFESVAMEWFKTKSKEWQPLHAHTVLSRLEKNVFPYIGNRPIRDLTALNILDVLLIAQKRGVVNTAHRCLSDCTQILQYAVITGKANADITQGLKAALEKPLKKHFASIIEPSKIKLLLSSIEGCTGRFLTCRALALAPLVFVRPGELRTAQWAHIDFNKLQWSFTVNKTKSAHIVPLSTQAIRILKQLHAVTGNEKYVFPCETSSNRAISDKTLSNALKNIGYSSDQMTIHGFRAMARTLLDEQLNYAPHLIEHQLAHAVKDTNGRAYNRTTHLPDRKEMMQAWANYLDGLRDNK